MKKSYALTKSAEADIREITRYTQTQWGMEQCHIHFAAFEEKAKNWLLAKSYSKT